MKFNRNLAAAFLTAVLALGAGTLPAHAEETAADPAVLTETTAAAQETDSAEAVTEAPTETETPAAVEPTEAVTETAAAETVTETETAPADAAGGSWQTRNGKRYYILANGEPARGELEIDGVPYLFGYSGAQKTDWQTVSGRRYYYDPKTGEAVLGWFTYFDRQYYISAAEGKFTGVHEIEGRQYRFSEDGDLMAGSAFFTNANGERGYIGEDGVAAEGLFACEDGRFITDAAGIIRTGSVAYDGTYYYANADGWLCCGLFDAEGAKYYTDPEDGTAAAGVHTVDEHLIFTDETGKLQTGWQEADGKRFFVNAETFFVECGLFEADGAWYYGTSEGLGTGLQDVDGDMLPFDETTGQMYTGWFMAGENKCYLDPTSHKLCKNGFFRIKGEIYYFNAKASVVTGLKAISGSLYAFDENGVRLTGLQKVGEDTYYFDPDNGYACTGVRQIEGGTIRLGADGKQIFGWQELNGELYYTDPYTGFVMPGQQYVNGKYFQFDAEGRVIPDARLYNQKDPEWELVQFNSRADSTMKASACGIFSFCNAIYALNGRKADAVEVAYWAIDVGAYKPGYDGTTRKIFYDNVEAQYGESLNFTLGGQYWGSISDSLLQNHLQSGGVAVIHVKGHFMAVVGYDERRGLYHVLESYESDSRGLLGDSWVDASKMSSGNTNVDWYVLISKRYEDGSASPSNTAPASTPSGAAQPDPVFPELFD